MTLSSADTVNSAQMKLMKTVTEWLTVQHRWTAIAQDSTAVFSSGSPPGSRPITTGSIAAESLNVNHVDNTVYAYPTTAPLQATLAAAIQAVIGRAGWASGNALGIVNQSKQDAGQQAGSGWETVHTFDSAQAASEPQLVIDYTAGAAGPAVFPPFPPRVFVPV